MKNKNYKFYNLLAFLFIFSSSFAQINKESQKIFKEKYYLAENAISTGNYSKSLQLYIDLDAIDPDNANINWRIGQCYLNSATEKAAALPYLEKAATKSTTEFIYDSHEERRAPMQAYYDVAHAYHLNYQLDTAISTFTKLKGFVNEKDTETLMDIDKQIKMCQNAKELTKNPTKAIITNLGGNLNSNGADFSPVISADESTLIFTSRREGSTGGKEDDQGNYFEDIYVSYNTDGSWSEVVLIDTNINSDGHEATIGLSADGQTLFIYKDDNGDGNIYSSILNGDTWSKPVLMGSNINTKAWETHAVVSADGQSLYFVSDREGGFGGRDLYKCIKLPNEEWSLAQNMGAQINTAYDEDAPFIHPDGYELFFSSNGHQTIGGFDIFSSILSEDNKWSKPNNIGYPINTTDDDIFYITSTDGKRAYYSSSMPGGFGNTDIYMINMPEAEEKQLTVLTGKLTDQYGSNPGYAKIVVTDNESGELIGVYAPNSKTGKYLLILPKGINYSVSYEAEGLLYHTENIYVPKNSAYSEINKSIELPTVRVGGTIILRNIFFEFANANLKTESKPEIDRVFKLMTEKEKISIEISGHTDAKGEPKDNLKLSQERAQAVVDALVEKGINKKRVTAKGYGETKPIAENYDADGKEDPKGMALNRRVELTIISTGKE